MEYKVISADNHIIEARNMFVDRLPAKFKDQAPRVVAGSDGGEGWSWGGKPPERTFGIEAVAGRGSRISGLKWEDLLPGNYDGAAHLKDMASDGVDAAVLFPAASTRGFLVPDREFGQAILSAYNDWLLEDFCAADPKRLIGLPMLPVDDGMDATVKELERCLKKGAKAFFLPAFPGKHAYTDTYYDPLWKAASEAGVSLNFHRTQGGKDPNGGFVPKIPGVNVGGTVVRFFSSVDTLTYMIFTGVFKRHPKLKVVAAEVNCGWIPFWKQTMDQQHVLQKPWAKLPMGDQLPSSVLGVNVFATTLDDDIGFELMKKDQVLTDMTMFSVDYPHSVCLWPHVREHIAKLTEGFTPENKKKVLAGTAVKVYNLG